MTGRTMAVLEVLAAEPQGWHYGYELLVATGSRSGSLYPILIRLAERGYLESSWEQEPPHGRPARHHYRITGAGLALVDADHQRTAGSSREIRRSPRLRTVP